MDEFKNQVQEIPAAHSSSTNATSELREFLNEAGKMLKALTASTAQMKSCHVALLDEVDKFEERAEEGQDQSWDALLKSFIVASDKKEKLWQALQTLSLHDGAS